jgi:tetratricopeptide (TPR) repeat protein
VAATRIVPATNVTSEAGMHGNRIGGACGILLAALACPMTCLAQAPAAAAPQPAADAPATEKPDAALDAERKSVARAIDLIGEKKPEEAIEVLDQVIARFERAHAGDRMRIYCARTPAEALMYMASAATGARAAPDADGAKVLDPVYAYAYYYAAYASMELDHFDPASAYLAKALVLSPSNPQFLSEHGFQKQVSKDWNAMLADFTKAGAYSEFASPDDLRNEEKARALRGQGYALIELNRLDEAKQRFDASLGLEPGNQTALNELEYIRRLGEDGTAH